MNKKSMMIMFAGVSLFAACSSPKYTYNFGYYKNNSAKLGEQPVIPLQAEEVNRALNTSIENVEVPIYASVSKEVPYTENENVNRMNERINSLQTKAERMENDLTLTKSEHKAEKKQLRQELKNFTKEIKKSPLSDESAKADGKSQLVALLLAIFLGGLGIHDFYLGHVGRGIIKIVLLAFGLLVFPLYALAVWVLVDIILIAIGTEKPKGGEYSKTL